MKPTLTHRYLFSIDEVVASLFAIQPICDYREIRIDGDEVVIEFVNPKVADQQQTAHESDDSDFPGDRKPDSAGAPAARSSNEPGPNEQEAAELCSVKTFQVFLEVKTEEAAQRVLLDRTHAKSFLELDTVKTWKANFRDVVAEYDMWMRE